MLYIPKMFFAISFQIPFEKDRIRQDLRNI